MWFIYLILFCLLFLGVFAMGELIVYKFPGNTFSKWWRKNVVFECKECD